MTEKCIYGEPLTLCSGNYFPHVNLCWAIKFFGILCHEPSPDVVTAVISSSPLKQYYFNK